MDSQPQFGFKELLTHIAGDVAKAVCERPNESKQQQFVRTQAAVHMILDLRPRDVIEAMLSGHIVMFHEMMTDSIHDTLQGQLDKMRRPTRANIVAMDKAFHANLSRLEHYQARPSQGTRDGAEAAPKQKAEADRMPRPIQAEASQASVPQPVRGQAPQAARPAAYRPSPEAIAACKANPEAMAALKAGDAAGFARAMGVEKPSGAYLAEAEGRLGKVDGVEAAVTGPV